ncbi:MAG: NAD(+) diphosphatase [Mobilicoccus sp.]|nr:NAD(+) diphosphatase [Mobilicoccus sp.]
MTHVVDRCSTERTGVDVREILADARILEVVGQHAPVHRAYTALRWRSRAEQDEDALLVFLGRDSHGVPALASCRAGEPPEESEQVAWQTLREVGPWLPEPDVDAFMAAQGMFAWHRTHGFCPRCGTPTAPASAGWVRRCDEGHELYPRTDPAVIMAIRDDADRILLGRGPTWPEDRRSVLAGFVEPGESLEDAVRREVAEEVGIVVGEVRYEGNQPWPFPASLMVGFAGRALTTDISCEETEMAEADWYTRADVDEALASGRIVLPGRLSIARRLIESWYGARLSVPAVDEPGGQPWVRPS